MTNSKRSARRTPGPSNYAEYERRKADWQRSNPEATPEEYARAMRRIAEECGV